MKKTIIKAGLCMMQGGKVLLARSKGDAHFQIPGGKIEPGETDLQALVREAREELDVCVDPATAVYLETFVASAAGRADTLAEVRLYQVEVNGEPQPSSEIEELFWATPSAREVPCSDVVRLHILPYLANRSLPKDLTR